MENNNKSGSAEPSQVTIQDKIQKLIDNFATLKTKYNVLKTDYEKALTTNIELDDEKNQWLNEKAFLEQKVLQLSNELKEKTAEIDELKEKSKEYDSITKVAVSKIDDLLSKIDFDE
ncbi:MAG: hypothetical protein FWG20_00665 [Candidatus Cloacimonetes bacterium]|nr:hypothetical protein [Candidatus Cloacimonadota bacterium]